MVFGKLYEMAENGLLVTLKQNKCIKPYAIVLAMLMLLPGESV